MLTPATVVIMVRCPRRCSRANEPGGHGIGGCMSTRRAPSARSRSISWSRVLRAAGQVEVDAVLYRLRIGDRHEAHADGRVLVGPDDDLALTFGQDLPAECLRMLSVSAGTPVASREPARTGHCPPVLRGQRQAGRSRRARIALQFAEWQGIRLGGWTAGSGRCGWLGPVRPRPVPAGPGTSGSTGYGSGPRMPYGPVMRCGCAAKRV